MEEIKVEVKINAGDMYNFFMYHTYTRASGILSAFFGVAMFGLMAYTYGQVAASQSIIYMLFAIFFLVFNPINFYARAQKQVRTIPTFKEPIFYTLSNEGITTEQNNESATIKWSEVRKVVSSGRSIIIYVSKVRANILPKKAIGDNYNALLGVLEKNLEPSKIKIKLQNI
ncbi:MAG: YcxB family protein [Lachnotalea sp.]